MAKHRKRGRPRGLTYGHGLKKYRKHRKHRVKYSSRGRPSSGFKRIGSYLGNALYIRR